MSGETPGGAAPGRSVVLAAVMGGAVLGPIDASIVNVVLPTLSRSFAASLATVQWVPMAYLLASGSLVLFFGRLGAAMSFFVLVYFFSLASQRERISTPAGSFLGFSIPSG